MYKKSNFKAILYSFWFYVLVCSALIIARFLWPLVLAPDVSREVTSYMLDAGIFSILGLFFTVIQAVVIYFTGRLCAQFSSNEDAQKPILLALLPIIPSIFLSLLYVGSDTVLEVIVLIVVTLLSYNSGFHSHMSEEALEVES